MITIGNYTENTQQAIKEGKVSKEIGGIAFDTAREAHEWGSNHLGAGNYQLYQLCDCTEDAFIDDSKPKYPTRKKLIKPLKMKPYVKG
jgi:hypothetical protein